ncbi:hypothetical protein ACFFHH_20315 [Cytobacillus solani]|uniref:Uncharacterized protein n=1 Tax=Cytobacillus solani TaxID=1637975 RepID=A0A0Q3VIT6_9BACI|nr:hypothetical protein [Cytobacillus solani]KOP84125.1 hypothetical protein AMS60_00325 [Bacillus sp. FJAT-21945]KQL20983.1 hypothetical protein AN957_21960 [Cytobacillus solani]
MLKVVIRHIDEEEGKALGEFSPERVDALVELVKTYGVWENGSEQEEKYEYCDSQFEVSTGVFEIIYQ